METKKIYLPMQMKCLMPDTLYKVIDSLFAFQKDGIVNYSKKTCECLHIDIAIFEQCVQTGINVGILSFVEKDGGIYKFKINEEAISKFRNIEWKDVPNIKMIGLATEIKFKNNSSESKPASDFDNMSEEDMKKMILMMQARLKEREEVSKIVQLACEPTSNVDDLPW